LRPTEAHWVPLLLLNGSSAGTGRRIVTTVLKPTFTPREGESCPTAHRMAGPDRTCLLLTETYHFHDLLADETPPQGWLTTFQTMMQFDYWSGRVLDDVRLSTAAHNSARFPIISPPGSVRNKAHQTIDRIVDGVYFENFGALTAMELADGIRAVDPALSPFVLVISNDPNLRPDREDESNAPPKVDGADIDDTELLTDLASPLATFLNTWDARGLLAVEQLRALLYQRLPACPTHVSHIRVWAQNRDDKETEPRAVSMSWWLSAPLQIRLHQQTEPDKNQTDKSNLARLDRVWVALRATSQCSPPSQ
jgi:hypothetical protein